MPMTVLNVLKTGRGWLAVEKPYGMSTHNDAGQDVISLAKKLIAGDSLLREQCGIEKDFAPAPVHRLDRETSGVLLLATRSDVARELAELFQSPDRLVNKTYFAVVRGKIDQEEGLWTHPLTDRAEGRRNPAGILKDRKPCATRFQKMRENPYLTQIQISLLTGRQHQIRRHAALSGHAIVGDHRYGDERHAEMIRQRFKIDRLLLHAAALDLKSRFNIEIRSEVPREFATVFQPGKSL